MEALTPSDDPTQLLTGANVAATSNTATGKRKAVALDWSGIQDDACKAFEFAMPDPDVILKRVEEMFKEAYPKGINAWDPAVAAIIEKQRKEFENRAMDEHMSELRAAYDAALAAVATLRTALQKYYAM